jgi:hypothetical protein
MILCLVTYLIYYDRTSRASQRPAFPIKPFVDTICPPCRRTICSISYTSPLSSGRWNIIPSCCAVVGSCSYSLFSSRLTSLLPTACFVFHFQMSLSLFCGRPCSAVSVSNVKGFPLPAGWWNEKYGYYEANEYEGQESGSRLLISMRNHRFYSSHDCTKLYDAKKAQVKMCIFMQFSYLNV